jgi:hypothetical protein
MRVYANRAGLIAVRPGVSTSITSPAIGAYAALYATAAFTTTADAARGSMPRLVS